MDRTKTQRLDAFLPLFLRDSGLETPLLQHRMTQAWKKVAGREFASHTEAIGVKEQKLWVHIKTPALRTQLSMMRQELIRKLNTNIGSTLIYDIKFV